MTACRRRAVGGRAGRMALTCVVAAGCGGAASLATEPAGPGAAADAPVRAVARFLDAAARRDHAAMAALFGTAGGPIGDERGAVTCGMRRMGSWIGLGERCIDRAAIELRMDVMARLLAHDAYRVVRQEGVAGRAEPSFLVEVAVTPTGGEAVRIPFVVTQAKGGRWLVAEVGLGRLAG